MRLSEKIRDWPIRPEHLVSPDGKEVQGTKYKGNSTLKIGTVSRQPWESGRHTWCCEETQRAPREACRGKGEDFARSKSRILDSPAGAVPNNRCTTSRCEEPSIRLSAASPFEILLSLLVAPMSRSKDKSMAEAPKLSTIKLMCRNPK